MRVGPEDKACIARGKSGKKGMRTVGCSLVIATLMTSGCWLKPQADWSPRAVRESQERGNEIVAALERFRERHGSYPSELSELVPCYLRVIEPPLAGSQQWHYKPNGARAQFELWFGGESALEPCVWYCPGVEANAPGLLADWAMDTK